MVPSTYFVDKMRKEGMIQKIDKTKLTNFSNLDPEMLNKPFDPNNDYSIPYIWGATAIGINSDAIDPKTVSSRADLWKPEYKSSLLLTDDAREVFRWRCVNSAIPATPPIRKKSKQRITN